MDASAEWLTLKDFDSVERWQPGCPLVAEHLCIVENTTTNKIYVRATLRNIGAKNVESSTLFCVVHSGDKEQQIEIPCLPEVPFCPGKTLDTMSKTLEFDSISSIEASFASVRYTDGLDWVSTGNDEALPQQPPLVLSDKAALQREKALLALYNGSKDKVEAAKAHKTLTDVDWWLCSCGSVNSRRENCWNCGADKAQLVAAQNEEALEKAADAEEAEKQEAERKKQETKQKLLKNRPKILAVIIAVAVIVLCGVLVVTVFVPMQHANAGDSARQQGEWNQAIAEYEAADGWADSRFYLSYTKCLKALADQDDASGALQALLESGYNLSSHVDEMIYLAQAYVYAEKFDDAVSCYQALADFADANGHIYDAYISAANNFLDRGWYASAIQMLASASEFCQDSQSFAEFSEQLAKVLAEKGEYKLAVRALELSADGDSSNKKIFDLACEGASKALDDGKLSQAVELYKIAGKYGDASEGISKCENIEKLQDAEKELSAGNLKNAQAAFDALPADLSYGGVNVGERQSLLASRQEFVDMAGKYSGSGHAKVTSAHKRSGSSKWWENDSNASATVSCKISDDGTVHVSGTVSFYRFTKYSTIQKGLKGNSNSKSFNFDATETPVSVDIGDNTTISISGSEISFNYYKVNENEDAYFNYTYESSGTLSK